MDYQMNSNGLSSNYTKLSRHLNASHHAYNTLRVFKVLFSTFVIKIALYGKVSSLICNSLYLKIYDIMFNSCVNYCWDVLQQLRIITPWWTWHIVFINLFFFFNFGGNITLCSFFNTGQIWSIRTWMGQLHVTVTPKNVFRNFKIFGMYQSIKNTYIYTTIVFI